MTLKKLAVSASLALAFTAFHPQEVLAEGFNNRAFLLMPQEHQKYWLNGAIDSLAHVAAFKKKDIGQCVIDWYFGDKHAQRNGLIFASMERYPDHTPIVVLVALTQRACGTYLKVE